ncbi:hypothetical protein Bcep1808_7530 (plasmid) [Burkholderia vietnamiensis G4]|uniref:Uncharacterized protein n=1 Tax=Burkholderia vietnamiensis (strain G4 / LMG 22486) TaxID=269482 RepID=A4JVV2_BURVG|nr:hypothetical protein Bcep1808_7530 [Burkholderia vietnamiensis G4]
MNGGGLLDFSGWCFWALPALGLWPAQIFADRKQERKVGFRCPACSADFSNARDTFKEHLKKCECGRALVLAILEDDDARNALGVAHDSMKRVTR